MKKYFLLLLSLLLLSGCSCNNTKSEFATEPTMPTEIASEEAFISFENSINSTDRAIAVMIDNDSNESRPHAGLEDAHIVYEIYVEGKATRLMALFKGTDTPKIGPVRSSRHYFLDYVLDNDALYSHAGFSPIAMQEIDFLNVDNLNGLVYEPHYYWREREYKGDYHSLYTSMGNLNRLADSLGYRKTSDVLPFNYSNDAPRYEGENALDVIIPYADFYYVSYKYNSETNTYERFINSKYHPTQSGAKLSAGQIIFQFVKNYPLGDGSHRIQLDTVGKGKGVFIANGMQVPLTWKRSSRTTPVKFYTADGKELVLDSTKQTYVQIIPENLKYTIK